MSTLTSALLLVVAITAQEVPAAKEKNAQEPPPTRGELESLAVQVEAAVVADRVLSAFAVDAKVDNDVLALEGTVPTEEHRDRLSAVAARQAGKLAPAVVNRVKVQAVEEDAKTKTTSDEPQDAVPTKLDKEQLVKLREVIREVMPNDAERLNLVFRIAPQPLIVVEGVLDTYDQKLELNRLIRKNYRGLSILNNVRVHVKPETPATAAPAATASATVVKGNSAITVDEDTPPQDRKLAEKVAHELRQDKQMVDAAIVVQADYDVIWLRGSVQSGQQRVRAVNKTYGVQGVEYVIDDLTVNPSPDGKATDAALADEDVDSYVRNYFVRRVGVSVLDVKVAEDSLVVVLEDDFVDDEERRIAQESVAELEKELGRKIEVEMQKQPAAKTKAAPRR